MDERIDMGLSLRERLDLFLSLHLGEWITRDMIFEGVGCERRKDMNDHMYTLCGRYEYDDEVREEQMTYEGGGKYVKRVKWFRFTRRRATRVPLFNSVAEKAAYMAERRKDFVNGTVDIDGESVASEIRRNWNAGIGVSSIVRDRPERLPWTEERRRVAQRQWQRMWMLIRTS